MNKNKFKKMIDKSIDEGFFNVTTLIDLLENDQKSLFNDMSVEDLIIENLDYILKNTDMYMTRSMLSYICSINKINKYVENNLMHIFNYLDIYSMYSLLTTDTFSFKVMDYINERFNEFLENYDIDKIVYLNLNYENFKLNDTNLNILNCIVEENLYSCMPFSIKQIFSDDSKDIDSVCDVTIKIIKELAEEQKLKYTDIKKIGSGSYSSSYKIGDKVLKLGTIRKTYIIPNDKRILKPLIRVDLSTISDVKGTIEVVNFVDTKVNLTKKEKYKLYKELKFRNIEFADMKDSNLGYLLSDNDYNWSKVLSDDPKARGLIGKNKETLKKGDIVIIDSDYLFDTRNKEIEIKENSYLYDEIDSSIKRR